MTGPAAADRPADAAPLWRRSVVGGLAAFAWVALAALAIGALEWLAAGRPFGVRLTWKLAGLYLSAFHGGGIRGVSERLPGDLGAGDVTSLGPELTLHVTFLVGTVFAGVVLWRAGRRIGRAAGGGWMRSLAWGASVAPSYALLMFAVTQVTVLRFPSAGFTEVRPVAVEAPGGALLLGLIAGVAGGAAAATETEAPPEPWGGRLRAWVAGGWHMTVALVVLAFAGFLVVAGLRSDVSAAYVRAVGRADAAGAIAAGHHVLLVANQSFLIAAPSMGGCVTAEGSGSQPTALCLRTLTVRPGFGSAVLPDLTSRTVPLSPLWLLFLLVPLGATVWGGHVAAAAVPGRGERALRGAGSGVVFAVIVLVGEAASAIAVERPPDGDLLRVGADPVGIGVLALGWGVCGGVLGALVSARRQTPVAGGPPADDDPDVPPRPTSA